MKSNQIHDKNWIEAESLMKGTFRSELTKDHFANKEMTLLEITIKNAKRHVCSVDRIIDIFEVAPFYCASDKIYVDSVLPTLKI